MYSCFWIVTNLSAQSYTSKNFWFHPNLLILNDILVNTIYKKKNEIIYILYWDRCSPMLEGIDLTRCWGPFPDSRPWPTSFHATSSYTAHPLLTINLLPFHSLLIYYIRGYFSNIYNKILLRPYIILTSNILIYILLMQIKKKIYFCVTTTR